MATTTKYISLDFYNNNVVNVYAKQSDANSRFINVTCTDYGKTVFVDKRYISAFIRMKKSDGTYVYNDTEILDDGTITITLTQQMLAISGKQTADLMLLSTPDVTSEELNSLDSIDDLSNVSVISVMSFYLIVSSSVVDNSIISSTNEFDALVQATARMKQLESNVRKAESSRVEAEDIREENEATRIANEKARISAENTRKTNESTRQSNENTRKTNETNRENAEAVRQTNEATRISNETNRENTMTQKIKEWNNAVDDTIQSCEDATDAANQAVAEFETIKDQSGIIMQSEKGSANGVATLDENGTVPNDQLDISSFIQDNLTTTKKGYVLDASQGNALYKNYSNLKASMEILESETIPSKISTLEDVLKEYIDSLPTIHFNDTVDDNIGKNGDVLMVPIEDASSTTE